MAPFISLRRARRGIALVGRLGVVASTSCLGGSIDPLGPLPGPSGPRLRP